MLKTQSQKHSEFEKWKTYVLEEWNPKRRDRSLKAYTLQKHAIDPPRYPQFISDLIASIGRVGKKHAL